MCQNVLWTIKKNIRELAFELANANSINIPNSWKQNEKAGLEWLHGFMARHPHLSVRQAEACSLSRCTSFNKTNVSLFFNNLEEIYERTDVFSDGTRIFNLDETATTTVQRPRKIVARKGTKQVSSATSAERGILVTTCCIVSASGNFLPPAMIFPRKKCKEHMLHGAPTGTLGLASSSGWMTVELFLEVMKHFIHHTKSSVDNPSLLIMDNHESHLSAYVLQLAKSNGVTILTLPPHCSNKMQPLDVAVFFPFKSFYNCAMESWLLHHPGRPITIYEIAECVGIAFQKALTAANISSGFRKTGIFPFDKNIFTEDDFIISKVTDREIVNVSDISINSNLNEEQTSNNEIRSETFSVENFREIENRIPQPGPSNRAEIIQSNIQEKEETKAKEDVHAETFISLEKLIGYPKAPPLQQKNKTRKRKSIIATDTPEKNAIEEKEMEKLRKISLKNRKKQEKAKEKEIQLESSSEDEDDMEFQNTSLSSDDIDFVNPSDDDFPELEAPKLNDFVIVQFNKSVYYVGQILKEKDLQGDYEVSFLRRSTKSKDSFVFPSQLDIASVHECDIKLILSEPTHVGKTKRQQGLYKFEVNFSSLDVR